MCVELCERPVRGLGAQVPGEFALFMKLIHFNMNLSREMHIHYEWWPTRASSMSSDSTRFQIWSSLRELARTVPPMMRERAQNFRRKLLMPRASNVAFSAIRWGHGNDYTSSRRDRS